MESPGAGRSGCFEEKPYHTSEGALAEPPPQPLNACDKGPGRRGGLAGRGHPRGRGEAIRRAGHVRPAAEGDRVGALGVARAAPGGAVAADAARRVAARRAGGDPRGARASPAADLPARAGRVGGDSLRRPDLFRRHPAEALGGAEVHARLDGGADLAAGEARRGHGDHRGCGGRGRQLRGRRGLRVGDRRGVRRDRAAVGRRVHHVGRSVGGVGRRVAHGVPARVGRRPADHNRGAATGWGRRTRRDRRQGREPREVQRRGVAGDLRRRLSRTRAGRHQRDAGGQSEGRAPGGVAGLHGGGPCSPRR